MKCLSLLSFLFSINYYVSCNGHSSSSSDYEDYMCSMDIRNVAISTYMWESSQLLTRNMYAYAVYEGDEEWLTKFYNVIAMRNGEMAYDSDFPLLEGMQISFDELFRSIYNPYEYMDYEQALAASTALVETEEEAEALVKEGKYDEAILVLTQSSYVDAKTTIEYYAKRAHNSLVQRSLMRRQNPPQKQRWWYGGYN